MKNTLLLSIITLVGIAIETTRLEAKHHKHGNHSGKNFGLGFGVGLIGGSILGASAANNYYAKPARVYYTPAPAIRTTYYTYPTAVRRTTTYYATPVYRPVVRTYYTAPIVTYYEEPTYYHY